MPLTKQSPEIQHLQDFISSLILLLVYLGKSSTELDVTYSQTAHRMIIGLNLDSSYLTVTSKGIIINISKQVYCRCFFSFRTRESLFRKMHGADGARDQGIGQILSIRQRALLKYFALPKDRVRATRVAVVTANARDFRACVLRGRPCSPL